MIDRAATISSPPSATLDTLGILEKNQAIGEAFGVALAEGITKDEDHIRRLSKNATVSKAYQRLTYVTRPSINRLLGDPKNVRVDVAPGVVVVNPSSVFVEIFSGSAPLNKNINLMIKLAAIRYQKQYGQVMPVQELLGKLANSYESYILPMASIHKADEKLIGDLLTTMEDSLEISEDRFAINPQILEQVKRERLSRKGKISALTRCVFLTTGQELQPFLDEPADFEDPMEDAFNLLAGFLKA